MPYFFGEDLAAFENGSVGAGAEGGDTRFLQRVHHAGHQRIVRRHKDQIHHQTGRQLHHAGHVGGGHVEALGVPGDAAVAGGAVELPAAGAFLQLAYDGVFTAAAAHHQNILFFHRPPAFPQ